MSLLLEDDPAGGGADPEALEAVHVERRAVTAATIEAAVALATAEEDGPPALRGDDRPPGSLGPSRTAWSSPPGRPVAAARVDDELRGSLRGPNDFHVALALEACAAAPQARRSSVGWRLQPQGRGLARIRGGLRGPAAPIPAGSGPRTRSARRRCPSISSSLRRTWWPLAEEIGRLAPFGPGHVELLLAVTGLLVADAAGRGHRCDYMALRMRRGARSSTRSPSGCRRTAAAGAGRRARPGRDPGAGRLPGLPRLRIRVVDYAEASSSPLAARRAASTTVAVSVGEAPPPRHPAHDRNSMDPLDRLRARLRACAPSTWGRPASRRIAGRPAAQTSSTRSPATVEAASEHAASRRSIAAFFEAFGAAGWAALERLVADLPRTSTSSSTRSAATSARPPIAMPRRCSTPRADAVTLSPYLGEDAIEPFLAYPSGRLPAHPHLESQRRDAPGPAGRRGAAPRARRHLGGRPVDGRARAWWWERRHSPSRPASVAWCRRSASWSPGSVPRTATWARQSPIATAPPPRGWSASHGLLRQRPAATDGGPQSCPPRRGWAGMQSRCYTAGLAPRYLGCATGVANEEPPSTWDPSAGLSHHPPRGRADRLRPGKSCSTSATPSAVGCEFRKASNDLESSIRGEPNKPATTPAPPPPAEPATTDDKPQA